MTDDAGPDAKIICVPHSDPRWDHVQDIEELPGFLLKEIEHFFEVYKQLEPGKFASTRGYEGVDAAWREVEESVERARSTGT